MLEKEALQKLLAAVAAGTIQPEDAFAEIADLGFESIGEFAKIDYQRDRRNGFPETIWGPGKTPEQIAQIVAAMRDRQTTAPILVTRLEATVFEQLQAEIPELQYDAIARLAFLPPRSPAPTHPGTIGAIAAGTADFPVAREAILTAELFGFRVKPLIDVGVAGIHRLLAHLHVLTAVDVIIVVAGMEGALPSVVGGLVDCPVIAVPTSVGYGTHFGGLAPLLTMLNSCASGIAVMNIDNGFGAAVLAGQILRTAQKLRDNS